MTLLDVVWDEALEADLAKVLVEHRLAPFEDPAEVPMGLAVRNEQARLKDALHKLRRALEGRRTRALDCDVIAAVRKFELRAKAENGAEQPVACLDLD